MLFEVPTTSAQFGSDVFKFKFVSQKSSGAESLKERDDNRRNQRRNLTKIKRFDQNIRRKHVISKRRKLEVDWWQKHCNFLSLSTLTIFVLYALFLTELEAQTHRNVHFGFPESWDGDKHSLLYCPSNNIPEFLAAYGDSNAPPGQRLTHMIDAIGAVGSFRIHRGEVTFMARYYPSRPYKIWEFYDRNMSLTSVPWVGWSDYNVTAINAWEGMAGATNAARFHPNIDFWRIGHRILAGTEAAYWIGYEFDVRTLENFTLFSFIERNDVFGRPSPSLIPISMAIHERVDASDGILWGSFSAMNFAEYRFYQGIFTIDTEGVRKVVGIYEYGVWDPTACGNNDEYIGDKTQLAGYIHSITSTKNYVILPITSLLINPCKFKEPPLSDPTSPIQRGGLWGMDFYDTMPVRFLIFDKQKRTWHTEKPLKVFPSMFITHQLNAYEEADNSYIVADMVVYDNHDPYVKFFYTDFLTSQTYPSTARFLRFTIDIREMKIMYSYLVPQETLSADFPQINHAYDGRQYEWAYILSHPFASENSLLKINVDNPGGRRNQRFQPADPDAQMPWFVSRPEPVSEDDGVLLIRALDLNKNKGMLLVVDAITMLEIGRAVVPISVPFGFHNRFFSRDELGLPKEPALTTIFSHLMAGHRFSSLKSQRLLNNVGVSGDAEARQFRPNMWRKYEISGSDYFNLPTTTMEAPPSWVYVKPKITPTPASLPTIVTRWRLQTENTLAVTMPPAVQFELLHTLSSAPTDSISINIEKYSKELESYLRFDKGASQHLAATQRPLDMKNILISQPTINSRLTSFSTTNTNTPSITIISSQSGGYNRLNGSQNVDNNTALREVYEKSLRALCRWLPKLIDDVTIEGCVQANDPRKRWMRPERKNYINNEPKAGKSDFDREEKLSHAIEPVKLSNIIHPLFKPVYSL